MLRLLFSFLSAVVLLSALPVYSACPDGSQRLKKEQEKSPLQEESDDGCPDYLFNVDVTVLDAVTRQPVEGAEVNLLRMGDLKKTGNKVRTDSAGKARLEGAVQWYYLSASAKGYRTKVMELKERMDSATLTLNRKK